MLSPKEETQRQKWKEARAALVSPREAQTPEGSVGDHKRSYDEYLEKTDSDEEKENGDNILVGEDAHNNNKNKSPKRVRPKNTPELHIKIPASTHDKRAHRMNPVLTPTSPVTPRTSNVHHHASRKRQSCHHNVPNRNNIPMTPMERAQWNGKEDNTGGSSYAVNGGNALYYPSYSPVESASAESRHQYERATNPPLAWRGHPQPPPGQYFPLSRRDPSGGNQHLYQEGYPRQPPAYPLWQQQQQQQQMRVGSPFYYHANAGRSLQGPLEPDFYGHFYDYGRHPASVPSQFQIRSPRPENLEHQPSSSPSPPTAFSQEYATSTTHSATARHSTSTPIPFLSASSTVDRDLMSPSPPPAPPSQQLAATVTTHSYNSERARHHLDKVLQTIMAHNKSHDNTAATTSDSDASSSASSLAEAMDALMSVLYCGRPLKTKVDDLCQVLFHSYPNSQPELYRETMIREAKSFLQREGVIEGG